MRNRTRSVFRPATDLGGGDWPIRQQKSRKCSWLAARSESSEADLFSTNRSAASVASGNDIRERTLMRQSMRHAEGCLAKATARQIHKLLPIHGL